MMYKFFHHPMPFLFMAALAYALWAAVFLIRENRRKKTNEYGGENLTKKGEGQGENDIIGKSHFVLPRRQSQPETMPKAAIETENEKDGENTGTFAPENTPGYLRQIATEELDEVFGEIPLGEKNEPLDIDYPLYAEPFPEAEETEDDFEDEDEDLPLWKRPRAGGVSFEELGDAYRHVKDNNPSITDKEKEDTGCILLHLEHTDMFEAIVSGSPEGEDRVAALIEKYLWAYHNRIAAREKESQPPISALPPGFDARKYV